MKKLVLITFVILIPALLISAPQKAFAQKACIVLSSSAQPFKEAADGFNRKFAGKSDEIIMPSKPEEAAAMIASLTGKNCEVVVPMGSIALKFLKLRLPEKPMVFAMTLSPAARGIEGLNVTGVYLEPSPKMQLAAIRKILPAARKIGILYSAPSDYTADLKREADEFGMDIVMVKVTTMSEAMREAIAIGNRSDVIMMIPDIITSAPDVFKVMLESSFKTNIPIFAFAAKHVQSGAIAGLTSDYAGNGTQAADLARKIAAGTAVSAIKSEYSEKAGLVINLKTAARMGIDVPASAINEAIEIYR